MKLKKFLDSRPVRLVRSAWGRLPPFIRNSRALSVAFIAILLAAFYWGVVASDRYVSEAHVVVDRTDSGATATVDFSSMLGLGSGNRDMMLLRDHLLSVDMAEKLDRQLGLRAHYSDWRRDPLSRLWFRDGPREWFHAHYLLRVEAEVDDLAGVLRIRVQAYSPEMAQALAAALVREGEKFMNDMVHALAREQVAFLEEEVSRMGERLAQARGAMIAFQDEEGLVSPESTVQGLAAIVNQLEGDLSKLRTQRSAMLGYLSPTAPDVVRLNLEIAAMERQVASERARLASPGGRALNEVAEKYQRLQLEAEFALDTYRTALAALERGRVDATRTIKKVSVVQAPLLPEHALEPRRLYNTFVFALIALLTAGIIRLLGAIIRDHKD